MLLERVRRALAPDYDILQEIAGGGMGVVFAAQQRRLDRRVAIKILRPEQATAIAAERFLAEGRLLARLDHPNIVTVYDAGEADGLLYYVMEFIAGETLAERLTRGPLPAADLFRLSQDLLAALTAAHALGVVHRDVKPANIFLRDGRALLGDFGIARWREENEQAFTTPGELIGTPRYMSPEQRDGLHSTFRTDVYAAGLVIWEAGAGSRWPFYQNPDTADWSRLPAGLAEPVRKALELDPERRWADARGFAAALTRRPVRRRGLIAVAAVLLLALATWAAWPPGPPPQRARGLSLELEHFATLGAAAAAEQSLGDSAAAYLRQLLDGNPDFYLPPPGQHSRDPRALRLAGEARVNAGQLQLVVQESGSVPEGGERITASDSGSALQWRALAESVADRLIFKVWKRAADDPFFPGKAIPASDSGRARLAKAEQFFSLGRWDEARRAYGAIEDSCLLCTFRSLDIARWFGQEHDSRQFGILQRAQDSFPEQYRALIRAYGLATRDKLDTLAHAASNYSQFFLAPFEFGDELFHRGPLFGRLRAEAIDPFRNALLYRPGFQPGIEHLTGLLIVEGDSAGAARQLDTLLRLPIISGLSGALTLLRRLGYTWRFLPPSAALDFSRRLLRDPMVVLEPDAAAAARLLMSMDAPRGAVEFGGLLANWPERPDAALPGLLGRLYGYAALGKLDSLRQTGERLARASPDPAYRLLALELEAVLRAFDPDLRVRTSGNLRNELAAQARFAANPKLRQRALWAQGLLAVRSDDSVHVILARDGLRDEAEPGPLGRILEAAALGRRDPRRALGLLPVVPTLDLEADYADLLEDAVVHLLTAEWQQRLDSLADASRTLRWHEHTQLSGHLRGAPQAGEMAWALGTLVRWKRAGILAAIGSSGAERCSVNRAVARLWADADDPFRARADSARKALAASGCPAAP